VSLYRRGNIWWSRIEWRGQVLQRSTKVSNKSAARDIEATWRVGLAKGEAGILDHSATPTLKEFQTRFFEYLPAHVSSRTVGFYKDSFAPLVNFRPLAVAKLNHIDADLLDRFVAHRIKGQIMPATINGSLRTLRRALHLAKDWKLVAHVPKIKLLPGERTREFVFTQDGQEKFLDAIPKLNMLWLLVSFLIDTGLRLSEALNLVWADVSIEPLKRGSVYVAKGKSKYAKRTVPLTDTARIMLIEARKRSKGQFVFTSAGGRRKMSRHWASEQFRDVRDKLGLPWDCVIHSCRHTFCTRLGDSGVDAFTIQKLAGHSSITISQRYVHPTGLELAIGKLDAALEDEEA
jgi:integrase